MSLIHNPVLRGFHPDPSFVRVGEDYYLASSTFEWLPGVRFHHSRDLVHWRLVGHALTCPEHIDLRGVDNSNGNWAPSLSYADGQFWLIYTNIRTSGMGQPFKDCHVYLTTAPAIEGPWSDPIYLNSIGFDPSLFHDDDGRKWLLNMQWDYRQGKFSFAGNIIQEYDHKQQKLIGPVHEVLRKDVLCEGPNIYKRDGWYYLMMAEGGTGWNHGISMARSRSITGPYELDPEEAILTTRHNPEHPLQKAGHGELVSTPGGEWWLAHLCSRPLKTDAPLLSYAADQTEAALAHAGDRCILGRETSLQRVVWTDDAWLRLADGGVLPQVQVNAPKELVAHPWEGVSNRDDFDEPLLSSEWSTLRCLADPSWLSLSERPGWLRVYGRECPSSLHEQSLLARRIQEFRVTAETEIEFEPQRYTQFAGLVAWYDTRMFYYLRVTHDDELGKVIDIVAMDDGQYIELENTRIAVREWPRILLGVEIDHANLQFSISNDGETWQTVGPVLDASKLSDDYHRGLHFTGAFLGLAAHDVAGQGCYADFDYFTMQHARGN